MDDINYKNLMLRIENFYNSDESAHDYRLNNAEEIITRWLEKGLFKKLTHQKSNIEMPYAFTRLR